MAITSESITTTPHTPSHLRVVIHRLRQRINDLEAAAGDATFWDGLAGENLAIGEAVYATAAGEPEKGLATDLGTSRIIGISTTVVTAGNAAAIQTFGVVTKAGWALTPNSIYYLSKDTAGAITAIAPIAVGETVVVVGVALSATELLLLLIPPILL